MCAAVGCARARPAGGGGGMGGSDSSADLPVKRSCQTHGKQADRQTTAAAVRREEAAARWEEQRFKRVSRLVRRGGRCETPACALRRDGRGSEKPHSRCTAMVEGGQHCLVFCDFIDKLSNDRAGPARSTSERSALHQTHLHTTPERSSSLELVAVRLPSLVPNPAD